MIQLHFSLLGNKTPPLPPPHFLYISHAFIVVRGKIIVISSGNDEILQLTSHARLNQVNKMEELKFTKTQLGKIKLGHKEFLYNQVTVNATANRFRCELYQSKKCPGRIYTNLAMNEVVSESKAIKHNHLPNHKNIEIRRVKQKIKTAARETEESTAQIIHAALPELSKEALHIAPSQDAMARLIRRSRYKKSDRREEPESFFDLVLQDDDKSTTNGEQFLLCDSAQDRVETEGRRLIIFATQANLEFLAKAEHWHLDGTFKCRPKVLRLIGRGSQLYVIMAPTYGIIYVPLLYALCSQKDEEMYM